MGAEAVDVVVSADAEAAEAPGGELHKGPPIKMALAADPDHPGRSSSQERPHCVGSATKSSSTAQVNVGVSTPRQEALGEVEDAAEAGPTPVLPPPRATATRSSWPTTRRRRETPSQSRRGLRPLWPK